MKTTQRLSLPIEIAFDLMTDRPETSGIMASLRKKGFEQQGISKNCAKVTFKGHFTGTLDDLKALYRSVKSHRSRK